MRSYPIAAPSKRNLPVSSAFSRAVQASKPYTVDRSPSYETEWVLLTSGTTGVPKLALHTLASLAGAIEPVPQARCARSFGARSMTYGAMAASRSFCAPCSPRHHGVVEHSRTQPPIIWCVPRRCGVTHISGTPSHWRRALMMSPSAHAIAAAIRPLVRRNRRPDHPRLSPALPTPKPESPCFCLYGGWRRFRRRRRSRGFSGEICRPEITACGDESRRWLLRIRSVRTAARYIGREKKVLKNSDGFVDTGDMLELRGDRYHFVGRRDGVSTWAA